MHYEALSRAVAYISCFSTLSLFASSMVLAAVNVAKLGPPDACMFAACAIHSAESVSMKARVSSLKHMDVVALAAVAK